MSLSHPMSIYWDPAASRIPLGPAFGGSRGSVGSLGLGKGEWVSRHFNLRVRVRGKVEGVSV